MLKLSTKTSANTEENADVEKHKNLVLRKLNTTRRTHTDYTPVPHNYWIHEPKYNPKNTNRVNIGGYSRTHSEKKYEINRNRDHVLHTNRSKYSETKITFSRDPTGIVSGPTGFQTIAVVNESVSYPHGLNLTHDFSNITYYNGIEDDKGEDNIHPLTHHVNQLMGISLNTTKNETSDPDPG